MKTDTAIAQYLKVEYRINDSKTGTLFTFEDGVTLNTIAKDSTGSVTYPAKGDVGAFTFPIRHSGDCLYALLQRKPIPAQCKAF